ncbi:MAG TPA: TolC family protein [Bryobacteraceae bacterium]
MSLLIPVLCGSLVNAQTAIRVDEAPQGHFSWLTHNYQARSVPPVNLANTSRLSQLLRAGNLYLTAHDVVALALENNIDIEVQRYGPLLAREVLRRAQGGGALRSVGTGIAAGPTSVSLTGVNINTNGAPTSSGGAGVSSGGGIVTQLGPQIPSFDPTISGFVNFAHNTSPQSNTFLVGQTSLVTGTRSAQAAYSQNFSFGMNAQVSYSSTRIHVNSNNFALNPYTNGDVDLTVTQNLLNGFGTAVNTRNIRVQKNNLKVTDLQFKQQVITTVSSVLNLYWDLVSFNEEVKSRQQAVDTADQLLKNNQEQVRIGTLAEIEVTRAQSQLYSAKQDLLIAQTNLLQQETVLKNALSRSGIQSADLADVHIVPLDSITVPAQDDTRSVGELVNTALQNRVELEQARINLESNHINLAGVKSSLKPSLQVFAELTNNGLSGDAASGAAGVDYFDGGYGNLLAQLLRRNFPNYSAGVSLNIPLRNRAAQSDYVTSQIEIRQNELNLRKQMNQVRVDVQNAVIGLQQARARYTSAQEARALSQQTFDGDQKKYELGASTPYQVVQDQRDLANSQSQEVQAMANYTHASIAFDQALGVTMDVNNISITEAMSGKVSAAPSAIPANPPAQAVRP